MKINIIGWESRFDLYLPDKNGEYGLQFNDYDRIYINSINDILIHSSYYDGNYIQVNYSDIFTKDQINDLDHMHVSEVLEWWIKDEF